MTEMNLPQIGGESEPAPFSGGKRRRRTIRRRKSLKRHKRPVRGNDGKFHIKGKTYVQLFGSRQQVWNKTAYKTTGNLKREDLTQNSRRRIVSKKKYIQGKKEVKSKKRLFKLYTAKKGKFGAVKRK